MRHDSPLRLRPEPISSGPDKPPAPPPAAERIPLGIAHADEWLGGGLAAAGLHETYAAKMEDGAAAIGFALALARMRAGSSAAPLVWLRQRGRPSIPYGPGLHQFGIAPAQVTLLALPDTKALLRAASDCARDGAAAAILLELTGRQKLFDLTASRRLLLSAMRSGTMLLLVRHGAEPSPSAAQTRWRVASAPSRALAANAPGRPAFDLALTRHKGGRDGLQLILEWNNEQACFAEPPASAASPLHGAVPAMAPGGERAAQRPRAA